MNRKQLSRILKAKGWKIDVFKVDFRLQDAILWHNCDSENPIIQVSKDSSVIQLIAVGDIRIYGKRVCFIYKGGKPLGELTSYLRKTGRWENNNWFEINVDDSSYNSFEEPFFMLNDATEELLSRLN
jgi:hypothetical protein